jgi:hypothetical protein
MACDIQNSLCEIGTLVRILLPNSRRAPALLGADSNSRAMEMCALEPIVFSMKNLQANQSKPFQESLLAITIREHHYR